MFPNEKTKVVFWYQIRKIWINNFYTKVKKFKLGCSHFFTIKFEFLVQICLWPFLRTSILEPSETLHIICIENITKPLHILFQLSKLFLNFRQGRKMATTLPQLLWLLRFFDCLAHPNLSATLATDQKWPLSHLRISYQSLAECH